METSREMGLTLVIPFYSSSTAAENTLTLVAAILRGGIVGAWGLFHYGVFDTNKNIYNESLIKL